MKRNKSKIRKTSNSFATALFPFFVFALPLFMFSRLHCEESPSSLVNGVWENSSRFVEFSSGGKMRIVLKPYYAFVYEDAGWIPCTVSSGDGGTTGEEEIFTFEVLYPGDKVPSVFSAALLPFSQGNGEESLGFFTRFFVREKEGSYVEGEEAGAEFSGFWICKGSGENIKLYRESPDDSFFCFYFRGHRYYKIRYWLTEARYRDVQAVFSPEKESPGVILSVPKFIYADGFLYTCVTGTGTSLRNYESGSWETGGNEIKMRADSIVYSGEKMTVSLPFRFSADGNILAFGEPYLSRSDIRDLDAEIISHNAKRRPPRKPVFEYMELDFHWDEIEELRK